MIIYRYLIIGGIIFLMGVMMGFLPIYTGYVSYKAKVSQEAKDQRRDTAQINQDNKDLGKKTEHDYKADLDSANKRIAYLLRMRHSDSCKVPGQASATSGIVATTPNPLPDYTKLATDCTKTTVMLVHLQDFEKNSK